MKNLTNETNKTIQMLPIERLMPHPQNPRRDLGDLTELTDSIRENGILQNLTVVPAISEMDVQDELYDDLKDKYMVVIGHRRLAAAELAGLTHVPCVVAELTPQEQIKTMLMENMQRSDLTLLEQADGFQLMLDLGMSRQEIAKDSGFSETTIRRRLSLRQLDRQTLENKLMQGATLMDLIKLEKIEDEEDKNKVLKYIGTSNFEWKLKKALEKQQAKKNLPKWLELIQAFASEITKEERKGKKWRFERTVWLETDPDIEALPDDTDILCYGYEICDGYIKLYYIVEEDEEEDLETLAKKAHVKEIGEILRVSTNTARELRLNFIKKHNLTKKQVPDAVRFLLKKAGIDGACFGSDIISFLMDVPTGNGWAEDRNARRDAFAKLLDKDYDKALLYMAYSFSEESEYQTYYDVPWDEDEYPFYIANPKLDRIYDFLESLGYPISDEERLLMSGEHSAFQWGLNERNEEDDNE